MSELERWRNIDCESLPSQAEKISCLWWQGWNTDAIAKKLSINARDVLVSRYGECFVREWERKTSAIRRVL